MSPNTTHTASDYYEIVKLKNRFAHTADAVNVEEFVGLFTEGAELNYEGMDGVISGHDEIEAFIEGAAGKDREKMHFLMNPVVDINGDTAEGSWYFLAASMTDEHFEWGAGEYHDEFKRIDDGWKISDVYSKRMIEFTHQFGRIK